MTVGRPTLDAELHRDWLTWSWAPGPTPVVFDEVRVDLLADLARDVLALERVSPCAPTLNLGGWKSGELFGWTGSAAAVELARSLRAGTGLANLTGWAMVNRRGASHPRHDHRAARLSGVYCVDPGDPPGTPTVFEVPTGEVSVDLAPGRLVLFRGDTWHRVPEYAGERPRITIAFDAKR